MRTIVKQNSETVLSSWRRKSNIYFRTLSDLISLSELVPVLLDKSLLGTYSMSASGGRSDGWKVTDLFPWAFIFSGAAMLQML